MALSNKIQILDSEIATGDDCISMGPGSKAVNITKIVCEPGHGISIGCLGKRPNEEDVDGITVANCNFTTTLNGVRIKTWAHHSRPSTVSNLTFEDIHVNNVGDSRVQISDVRFRNIQGTTRTKVAVNLPCSQRTPWQMIELTCHGTKAPATSSCSNVHGFAYGQQIPPSCIQTS